MHHQRAAHAQLVAFLPLYTKPTDLFAHLLVCGYHYEGILQCQLAQRHLWSSRLVHWSNVPSIEFVTYLPYLLYVTYIIQFHHMLAYVKYLWYLLFK